MHDPDFNPYAAPKVEPKGDFSGLPGDDVWVDGDRIVMMKKAVLPRRCLKCNDPTDFTLTRNLSWHPPILYVVLIFNLLIYLILALSLRHTAKVDFPICETHRRKRMRAILLAWLFGLGSLGGGGLAAVLLPDEYTGFAVVGMFVGFIASVIYGVVGARIVDTKRIDKTSVILAGACPEYLAQLEPMPAWVIGL